MKKLELGGTVEGQEDWLRGSQLRLHIIKNLGDGAQGLVLFKVSQAIRFAVGDEKH